MTISINARTSAGSDQVGSLDNAFLVTLVAKLDVFSSNIANQAQPPQYYMTSLSAAYGQDVTHAQSTEYRYEWDPKTKKYLRFCYDVVVSTVFGGTSDELIAEFEFGMPAPLPLTAQGGAVVVDGEVIPPQ